MSEYQCVKFRAVDRPLTTEQMEFMGHQSSRADFSKWGYDVEYHYSSFRGDIDGMLRNGYDVFLNWSKYGDRGIRLRLPAGLPFPESVWSKYLGIKAIEWRPDEAGPAGNLAITPAFEEAYDEFYDLEEILEAAIKLRGLLIGGDLRALYFAWLCCLYDYHDDPEIRTEPPVPHGLSSIPRQLESLLEFFTLDPLAIDAAAENVPAFDPTVAQKDAIRAWIDSLSEPRRIAIIQRLLSDDPVALKTELRADLRDHQPAAEWPVSTLDRTVNQLLQSCAALREQEVAKEQRALAEEAKRKAEKEERLRQARLLAMKSNPEAWLKKVDELVKIRGTDSYREAASILADLREAIGGYEGAKFARQHAAHLIEKHPTLNVLKSSLRKRQLWD